MATRGNIRVIGVSTSGEVMIVADQPHSGVLQLLMQAKKSGEPLEIRQVIPTRGPKRRQFEHKLKIAE